MAETKTRKTFGAEELATCLSHYDLGIIYRIRGFARGSRQAPKAIVESQKGKFLLKRRHKGIEDIKKIAFTHQIQLSLAAQNFPLPHLLGTRDENNSMLVLNEHIYEMQEYISGTNYDGAAETTEQAGHTLGLYHKLLADFQSDFEPVTSNYHNTKVIHRALQKTTQVLHRQIAEQPQTLQETIEYLRDSYRRCAASVDDIGLQDWPSQIVHGDWHPGNMLFRDRLVVAVIDYDTARLHQRVIDLANGALQFSILGGGEDPLEWPESPDMERFGQFLHGYDSVNVITTDELRTIPLLMCEAMIAEAVLPIASTGEFGRFEGSAFLTMIRRKVEWIFNHVAEFHSALADVDEANDEYTEVVESLDRLSKETQKEQNE